MTPTEAIAAAYLREARGDPERALRAAIADALADLTEWERRTRRAERLVSRGFARGRIGPPESGEDARSALDAGPASAYLPGSPREPHA
jgi:hypothetical protein